MVWLVAMALTIVGVVGFSSCTLDPSAGAPGWDELRRAPAAPLAQKSREHPLLGQRREPPPSPWREPPGTPSLEEREPTDPSAPISDPTHASARVSAIFGHGILHVGLPATLALALVLRALLRRRGRREAATTHTGELRAGRATITGVVEVDEDAPPGAIEVLVQQRKTVRSDKGKTYTTWTEFARSVVAKPFAIRRADGTRVRVEARCDSADATEVDLSFPPAAWVSDDTRTRVATLVAGQEVYVTGDVVLASSGVGTAYRAASIGPRIVAKRISHNPPGTRPLALSRVHAGFALGTVWVWLFVAGIAMPAWEILTFDGEAVTGQLVATSSWKEWVKPKNGPKYLASRFAVKARVDGSDRVLQSRADSDLSACVESGGCTRIPFVVARHFDGVRALGDRPTIHIGGVIVGSIFFAILAIVYGIVLGSSQWRGLPKLVESS